MTFAEAEKLYASARDKIAGKPLENNTRLVKLSDDTYGVKLHSTVVVFIHYDGTYALNTGGWRTVTTKDRINRYAPCVVYSDRGTWYVKAQGAPWKERGITGETFRDGMHVAADGTPLVSPAERQRAERLVKRENDTKERIRRYADKVARWLKHEQLVSQANGDCWFCSMRDENGTPMGDLHDDSDHLAQHMQDGYVMVSLLVNALKAAGYRDEGVSIFLGYHENGDGEGVIGGIRHNQWGDTPYASIPLVKRAVRKYMANRLVAVGAMR
jgi:hypothetical protein